MIEDSTCSFITTYSILRRNVGVREANSTGGFQEQHVGSCAQASRKTQG